MSFEEMKVRQIALEEEAVFMGRERYMKNVTHHISNKSEDQTAPVVSLMKGAVGIVAEAIEKDRHVTRRGIQRTALPLIESVDSYTLAWHGLRKALSSISHMAVFTVAAEGCGRAILDEINFCRFQEEEARKYQITQEHIKQAGNRVQKERIVRRMFSLAEITPAVWSREEVVRVGAYVLNVVVSSVEWLDLAIITESRNRKVRIIRPTPDLLRWLGEAHAEMAGLCPARMPMIIKPRDWTSPTEGGYLTDHGGRLSMLKTYNTDYLEVLHTVDMPVVYTALNTLQSVPWRINRRVLEAAQKLWDQGVAIGKQGKESMPNRDPYPVPAIPAKWDGKVKEWRTTDYKGYKLWAQRAAQVHEQNRRLISKRVACATKLTLGHKFVDEGELFFVHQMDFRGRVYPVASHLNPQSDDMAKGMLEFADGKRLGKSGLFWLYVHTANCFGIDKVSFEERYKWTEEHMPLLLDAGMDPVDGERFWMSADDPFVALACCFELVGAAVDGEAHVSHLPVSMDGSNNGLQNFSALLLDEIGGKATNLVPSEQPEDIYQEVADLVAAQVRQDAEQGDKYALMWDGHISRSIVKQPVMTMPYGATHNGMLKQIEAAVKKAGNPMALSTSDSWSACSYLAKLTETAISQVVVAASVAMGWLQKVARTAASEDFPLSWTTPVGLPVLQEYRQPDAQVLRVHLDGQKVKLSVNRVGTKLDRRRQASGVSPNVIHSFDAAHMMMTTVLAEANGVTHFAMIHDSFGCHAADIDVLNAAIRESFVEMYSEDLLAKFRDQVQSQLPADLELPELPPKGTLDLAVVRDSAFFFS